MVRANVIATSGRAVEAAGDVDVLLLDKTGTITLGDRQAFAFIPAPGVSEQELADVAQLASLADETPEGRSIVVLAKQKFQLRGRDLAATPHVFHKFSAQTRMSGVDLEGRHLRKGAADAVRKFIEEQGGVVAGQDQRSGRHDRAHRRDADRRRRRPRALGVVELRDIVKGGIRERFAELRQMGIKTIMVTGDNRLTAAAIAAEAGVDDFLAEATPEKKLELIRKNQAEGRLVAMCGDGTNDAPALAQADVAVAMNTGTQAAKEAGNMVDLDSNPTKLIEVVDVGKQMLVTRGALTTFSIANDVSKYFAIIPAAFAATYPALDALNVMRLATPQSAILSAVIFNAIVIPMLVPLALRGVKTRAASAAHAAAAESADLRARRHHRAVHRHQGHRPAPVRRRCGLRSIGTGETSMSELRPALVVFGLLTLLTGVVYPLVVTGIGQARFTTRRTAASSQSGDRAVGSRLLGQPFSSPKYFWSRPSATGPQPYNGARLERLEPGSDQSCARIGGTRSHRRAARRGSGQYRAGAGGSRDRVRQRSRSAHLAGGGRVSGRRVSRARERCPKQTFASWWQQATDGRTFGILGEPRVNVLELNLALDAHADAQLAR